MIYYGVINNLTTMTKEELWQNALTEIELNVSRANFITWFRNTSITEKKENSVVISVPNGFSKEWLQNKFNKIVLKSLRNLAPEIRDFSVIIESKKSTPQKTPRLNQRIPNFSAITDQLSFEQLSIDKDTNLNPKYRFDNYIVGSSNEVAHAAASAISDRPGREFNPFFIYGGVGLGKTHLLHAMGNAVKERAPSSKIQYINSETFTNEFINAIHSQSLKSFRARYRPIDVLIIDDIQFIARKERTQEEFFHTFNTLYANNKQIILSSDRPPKQIDFLDDRLRSRFEGGMIADIGYPEFEMRVAILQSKMQDRGVKLPDEVVHYIADNILNNIRELEGALNIVLASLKTTGVETTVEKTKKNLEYIIKKPKRTINFKKIIKCIAGFYDISEKDLISPNRRREVAYPRQVMMYIMREEMKFSYPLIGSRLGGRDHTTVIHACTKISESLKNNNEQLVDELNSIKKELYSIS